MKKKAVFLAVIFLVVLGCAGQQINNGAVVKLGADLAFVQVLKNNPEKVPQVIAALEEIRTFATGEITYNDLAAEIAKRIAGDYALEMTLISDYLLVESPVIDSITIFEGYREELLKRIDRLILLAGMIDGKR
ncbi:MAG: hypothetical protein BWX51_02051 [Bacteroidetes bacterium ADurb.Bin012]|jgi:hypothetical protein|nr:MAG: hypothetical protein BWX51_02051 [Bacteroidetes bacterium ADurb.Bin012]